MFLSATGVLRALMIVAMTRLGKAAKNTGDNSGRWRRWGSCGHVGQRRYAFRRQSVSVTVALSINITLPMSAG